MKKDSEKLRQDIQHLLNDQNDNLDGATLSRLNQARQQALSARRKRRSMFWGWSMVPAAFVIILVLLIRQPTNMLQPAEEGIADLQILTSEDSLEFFQEDMAFYEWVYEITEEQIVPDGRSDSGVDTSNTMVRASSRADGSGKSTGRVSTGWRTPGVSWFI